MTVQTMGVSATALDRPPERALASIARAYLRLFDDEETVYLYRMGLIEAATNPQLGEDHLEAGMSLRGSEVKSCRQGRVSLEESWVRIIDGGEEVARVELDVRVSTGMDIPIGTVESGRAVKQRDMIRHF